MSPVTCKVTAGLIHLGEQLHTWKGNQLAVKSIGRLKRMVMRLTVVWVRVAGVGDLDDLAGTYDRHPPSQVLNLAHDVRAEENGRAGSVGFTQEIEHLLLHQWIETTGGLIQEQQLGTVHQGLDDTHLLLVALGEVLDGLP